MKSYRPGSYTRPPKNKQAYENRLREVRKNIYNAILRSPHSIDEIADLAGLSRRTVYRLLDEKSNPSVETLVRLEVALKEELLPQL